MSIVIRYYLLFDVIRKGCPGYPYMLALSLRLCMVNRQGKAVYLYNCVHFKVVKAKILSFYSRFQVTFQSPVPKFVLNIPNYITKFGILCGICKAKFACR